MSNPVDATCKGASQRFGRHQRIRCRRDFDRVYRSDVFAADQVLVINACKNELPHARLGLSVSRRVGNAIVRNRWKRLIREGFRKNQHNMPHGIDYVVRPRRGAEGDLIEIERSLRKLAEVVSRRLQK